MAPSESTSLPDVLAGHWTAASLTALARQMGVLKRARKKNLWVLLWTLCLGFQSGSAKSLTALFQTYTRLAGHTLSYSSFYAWFSPDFAKMLKAVCQDSLQHLALCARLPHGVLAQFAEVLAIDATILRLHDLLAVAFPATRTNVSKAAAKLHLVYNILECSAKSVRLSGARTSDGTPWKRLGGWVRGRLLLFDLGYYDFHFFARIHDNGGYFVSRVKSTANPRIVQNHRTCRGQSVAVVGQRLQEVLPRLERDVLDVEVEVEVKQRAYRGKRRTVRRRLRLVGLRRPEGGYFLYFTNLPPEKLPAEDVCVLYSLRWQIELFFKCLKAHLRLDELPSGKQAVMEALVWAALLASVVSHRLLRLLRQRVQATRHLPVLRWTALFARSAETLLELVLSPDEDAAEALLRHLAQHAPDPNRHRDDRALTDIPLFADPPDPALRGCATPRKRDKRPVPTEDSQRTPVSLPKAA